MTSKHDEFLRGRGAQISSVWIIITNISCLCKNGSCFLASYIGYPPPIFNVTTYLCFIKTGVTGRGVVGYEQRIFNKCSWYRPNSPWTKFRNNRCITLNYFLQPLRSLRQSSLVPSQITKLHRPFWPSSPSLEFAKAASFPHYTLEVYFLKPDGLKFIP